MAATSGALPDFRNPPLSEVALAVQWDQLPAFGLHHFGLLWDRFRDRFPTVQQYPELSPMMERAGSPGATGPQLQLSQRAPAPRLWFLDEGNRELVQIQGDRFVRNWRKIEADDVYPRYENYIRPSFVSDFDVLQSFMDDWSIGTIIPNQCEVVYVNQLVSGEGWNSHGDVDRLFSEGLSLPVLSCEADAERARFEFSYALNDDSGSFVGRLYVSCTPGIRQSDGAPVYNLTLTARGRPLGEGIDGVLAFLDFGRAKIVRAFADITSAEMHRIWERQDG